MEYGVWNRDYDLYINGVDLLAHREPVCGGGVCVGGGGRAFYYTYIYSGKR